MEFRNLYSKPVLLLYEGKIRGKVSGALVNKRSKKIDFLTIGLGKYSEFLAIKRVAHFGEDSIVVMNDLHFKQTSDINLSRFFEAPLMKKVYSTDGNFLGIINDVIFDDTKKMIALQTDVCTISTADILRYADELVLTKGEFLPKISKRPPKVINRANSKNIAVQILTDKLKNENSIENRLDILREYPITKTASLSDIVSNEAKEPENTTLQTVISNHDFLLGRRVSKDILSFNNELIVKKDSIITTKIVELCQKAGKFIELTVNSRL